MSNENVLAIVASKIAALHLPADRVTAAQAVFDEAGDFEVGDAETRALADADLGEVARLSKELEAMRKEGKAPILEATRLWDERFKAASDFLVKARAILTEKILAFDKAERERRVEAQKVADAAAAAERARLLEAAKDATAPVAAALQEAAALVVAPVVALTVPKEEQSTAHVVTWGAEVFDLLALAKAVVDGTASLNCIQPDQTYLNGRARLEKGGLAIPGVKSVSTESLRAKRAA